MKFGNLSRTQFGGNAQRHAWTGEEAKASSGICRRPSSGVTRKDIHEPAEKQSQSCCPKKSGFRVWTSGRFVNVLDEKDILVCVHTRNILWGWGCFRYVKVPSSPYKRGREGTCKRIQIFWNLCNWQRELQSLCTLTVCLNVLRTFSLFLACSGIHPSFSGNPPILAPTVFQPTRNSRCHLRRNPRRTFRHRQTETITILPKGMKPLSFLNLLTQQTKNGEKSSKLSWRQ
jgi:hypothetical protein